MKRNPRKVKWTKAYRKLAGKDLADDAVFDMERRRNVPVKYDREVVAKSVAAMKRTDELRVARAARHHARRMRTAKARDSVAERAALEHGLHLVKAPGVVAAERAAAEKVAAEAVGGAGAMDAE